MNSRTLLLGMLKKAVQQGRSERGGEATLRYVEPLGHARTPLDGFFSILLGCVLVFVCVRLQPIQPVGQSRLQDK